IQPALRGHDGRLCGAGGRFVPHEGRDCGFGHDLERKSGACRRGRTRACRRADTGGPDRRQGGASRGTGRTMRGRLRRRTEPADAGSSDRPRDFHRRLPGYLESPLVEAPRLAEMLGVGKVFVKNETSRFGLPSFKILGASWATYAALRERLGPMPDGSLSHEGLQVWASPARPLTLLAATDGNHGRAVARVAKWLGLKARIFVPNFVATGRLRAIEDEGAELVVIDGVYDASVDAALEASRGADTLLISDTARSVSDVVPRMVTAGYTTAFAEIEQQLSRVGD